MAEPVVVHASAVALNGRAVLIAGPSGSGKSALALSLMAHGAGLIADDRTCLTPRAGGPPVASAPAALRGMIEARGIGLLAAEAAPPAPVVLAVDLGQAEAERLPPERTVTYCDVSIPLLHGRDCPHLAVSILQWLKGGRMA